MANMTELEGAFNLPISITSDGTVTKTLQTKNKYVDKNITIAVTTPDATFEKKDKGEGANGEITATATVATNTYTTDSTTRYPITAQANAHVNAVTVGTKVAGFTAATDETTIAAADATQNTKTVYIKEGSLTNNGAASATGVNGLTLGSALTAAPASGYYVKATASGSASVDTEGYVDKTNTASSTISADSYYPVQAATLANTMTTNQEYTTPESAPVLISGSGLYINEGYIENTYISLATLVPDNATIEKVAVENGYTSPKVHNSISVYDKDGTLIAGTMQDVDSDDISVSAASASSKITTVTAEYDSDNSNFKVTGSGNISGTVTATVNEEGFIAKNTTKTANASGTSTVEATLDKISLAASAANSNITVKPTIIKDTSTAASGDITTEAPTDQKYIAVNANAVAASTTVTPVVSTAGYGGTGAGEASISTVTVTGGSSASDTYYVPIQNGSVSEAVSFSNESVTAPVVTITTAANKGSVTPVTYTAASKDADKTYIGFGASSTATAGKVQANASVGVTEGYVTAKTVTGSISKDVTVENATGADIFVEVYDGSWI